MSWVPNWPAEVSEVGTAINIELVNICRPFVSATNLPKNARGDKALGSRFKTQIHLMKIFQTSYTGTCPHLQWYDVDIISLKMQAGTCETSLKNFK